jgi:cytosine/adenosine deaminase-related metal-dependent hydrolase
MRGIAATFVVIGDGVTAPIAGGAVVLDDASRVVAVGPRAELERAYPGVRFEAQRAVLMPGLVNAHVHIELSAMRGQVKGGRGFTPWVAEMLTVRERLAPEHDIEAIDRAVSELLGFGTAAVGEVTNTLAAVPYLGTTSITGRIFHEVFGSRRESAEGMLLRAKETRAALSGWPDNLSYTLAPHTPYTLHPDVLKAVVGDARAAHQLTSLHLCEHPAERKLLLDGGGPFAAFLEERGMGGDWPPPAIDPVRYAQALGALAPDVLCVHLTEASPEELRVVAAAGAKVVLCPRSNLHIEVKLPPLVAILDAGLQPALGTDSLASCPSLDVLEDARALAERFSSVPARTLIAMATSYGADALGFGDTLGTLAPGKAPGVLAFPHGASAPADPERFLLSRTTRERIVLAPPAPIRLGSQATREGVGSDGLGPAGGGTAHVPPIS